MSKSARVPEPSMEEILASIRRIIADDAGAPAQGATPGSPAPAQKPAGEASQSDFDTRSDMRDAPPREADVLELTEPVDHSPAPAFTAVPGADVVFQEEDRHSPAGPVPAAMALHASAPVRDSAMRDDELLSPSSTAAVSAAFNSLAATVLSENARTLEDLVKEMMRPMLKSWLDENLPGLVERIVRAEIERVARGGR